jgi:hypothetical protein
VLRARVRADAPVTVLVSVPVTVLVTVGTTLAAAAEGAAGSDWLWGCDPADWPGAAGPRPWVMLRAVWLTLVSAPPAAGTVPEPPDPPGKMSWATPLTADAAALAAGGLVAGAGAWFAAPLVPGGGAGTLAAGAAEEEAALAAGAWLAGPGWPAELGWPAEAGWADDCGAGGWPAEDGPWLPPLPGAGVLPGPGRRLWAAPATEPATEVTLPAGRPAVSPLTPAAAAEPGGCPEPGFCVEAGFWSADARPARSTAKTSAAAKPPHAYRQTLTTSSNARERVADPSTANTLPPDPGNYPYFPDRRTAPDLLCCPGKGRLPA